MWLKWFLFHIFIQVSKAGFKIPSVDPSVDGKSLILMNETHLDLSKFSQFEFQVEGTSSGSVSESGGNGTGGRKIEAQGIDCPTPTFNDLVLAYLTAELSDSNFFQQNELPPFLQPRFSGSPNNVAVKEYIKTTFTTLGWTVEEDLSYQVTPIGFIPFTNVIATFNPQYAKRLVLACHFDSLLEPSGHIGAINAAVPCAMLIDLAKRLNELFNWADSPVAIQMIFFDGKEPYETYSATDSLYGSRHLAAKWSTTADLGNIDYFILMDVLGHAGTSFERFYTEADDLFTQFIILEACLALKNLGTRPLPLTNPLFRNSRRETEVYDDQIPFRQYGVLKTLHLVTYPFPPEWHSLEDTADILDFQVIEDLNRILRVFVANYYIYDAYLTIYQQ